MKTHPKGTQKQREEKQITVKVQGLGMNTLTLHILF